MEHVAMYVTDLEKIKAFYQAYFRAEANAMYHNQKTGLKTYFLSFEGGSRLEIMSRPDTCLHPKELKAVGLIHLAFCVDGKDSVDQITSRLKADGYTVVSEPRVTGDGYYESCILDPEGNQVEVVAYYPGTEP